ncbi:kinase-like protein [Cylindrobasidium torrendii FP15055 ss-10]|uniref:non-specific serine/threonine protein kinase n=1 Tax=Cylindrobasidium torrendii FP15055 ss-10 TaxID=1314674 RepID=A0A0D7BEA7_9AGAR|nr:kinase-like protein [Cylindrobasidium torrendii FP15055 ss-10]
MASAELCQDDFHFSSMETTEDMTRYVPGGYHPVIIGQHITNGASSYRIMHKLGFGSYATVWLAEKSNEPRSFVAMKITTADSASSSEADWLRRIQNAESSNIIELIDAFDLQGPNGIHSVLVTDVVAPVLSHPTSARWCKAVARGLAHAVKQLHASGIVHGDLHLGNVGIGLPQLADQDPDDVMQDLDTPEVTLVLTSDPRKQTPSLPAYVVAPCNLAAYSRRIPSSAQPQVKIFDFGNAHENGAPPVAFQCALEACSPEVVFARAVEKVGNPLIDTPSDVWALGAMIFELVTGSSLCRGLGMSALPVRMVEMTGTIPSHWQTWWNSLPRSPLDADAWWAQRRNQLVSRCADERDGDALLSMLRRVLVLDPAKRPSSAEVCHELWLEETMG